VGAQNERLDRVTSTYNALLARVQPAFDAFVVGADPVLRPSDRGDFQLNGVMGLAKALGRSPRDVATELVSALEFDALATYEVAGPGFINVTLKERFISSHLLSTLDDVRLGIESRPTKTVVIDYSAPNVAKEMHVGHLRSTVIGDALRRLNEFAGYRVIARNHVGDWGTPFGMLIEHLVDLGEAEAVASLSIGDLNTFYRGARAKFEVSDEFKVRSRQRVVALQAGDSETLRLWEILVSQSVAYFDEVYAKLDVELTADEIVGESFYNDQLDAVVRDLDAAGLIEDSDGALCVFPTGFANREGEPLPLIIRKRDEGFGYAATDLAALRDRVDVLGADEILYVVGAPQAQHLAMVFATARLAGWLPERVTCEHVGFGNVLDRSRKMFKSREGDSVKLVALLDAAVERAESALAERDSSLDADERRHLALQIARAAIKYSDLSTERQRDYVFDLDRMVAFEGETGPYLAYAHARIRSIFRRLDAPWEPVVAEFSLTTDAERSLALAILSLPEAFESALELRAPHKLCTYLFDLAQRFTTFYEVCPVLNAPAALREERLALCDLSARTLALGLDLLGIEAPQRM
jgi:arginyl-tRNA synthetase